VILGTSLRGLSVATKLPHFQMGSVCLGAESCPVQQRATPWLSVRAGSCRQSMARPRAVRVWTALGRPAAGDESIPWYLARNVIACWEQLTRWQQHHKVIVVL
jgi:hypothetical protein